MCMRTTLNIDDEILKTASELTGVKEKTSLVRLGLETLIALESSQRLASLGGTEKELRGDSQTKDGQRSDMTLVDTSVWVSYRGPSCGHWASHLWPHVSN